jgi:phosphoribosylformimino-5-aminoimidazole carboxamide ribotide isomerase
MPEQRPNPRLIPVLDVMGGGVVRAVGGIRENYQPIACPETGSRKPFDMASALLQIARANELYVADLDAITKGHGVSPAVRTILEMWDVPTWLDAGIGCTAIRDIPALPHLRPVVGFETCREPGVLTEALWEEGERRVAFSIDLKLGRLLGDWRAWGLEGDQDALSLARRVVALGLRTLIVLDLARVGTGTGSGTESLLKAISAEFPDVELIAGGGVKTWADVDRLGEVGADAVLVASALHDGTITFPRPAS